MNNITVVKIKNPERYNPFCKTYGILQQRLLETSVINFDSNRSGICINIAHEDYTIIPSDMVDTIGEKIIIQYPGGHIDTGLKFIR